MTENGLFVSSFLEVEKGWIDYNNHLNMGYYTVVFDRASDELWDWIGFGERYVAETNHTTFAAEFHVRYLREVKLGDRLYSRIRIIDHDEKRFHTFQELYHEDGWLSATGEGLTLHVDLGGPKVAPMPENIQSRIRAMAEANAKLPPPEGLGRSVGLRRKVTSG
ncbi:thioesterase family protein [Roseovarius indicus]|uniref:L-carnitine dehydrogenase n=1 Tax=Roseovarius indicus TaxID=540747 RepID=A0A0T5PDJ3_9RHOB|nr:thioesterase family protein [Roseovarius indicus]KRS19232.1 thioesterase [Roseovarius indicus]QEW26301.1 L-carnitine dehydrogenase [Roseovarius indicus]SFD95929.1 acyl-CoA thioester hydrolase [Roseovarius indicus]